ncbi:HIT family protein [archaeon]|jgi:histidine triad (HIT) family protein|nr:HIT family protein [archaeon]
MEDCVFCKIIKGEIPSTKVYEDEFCFAFLDIEPVNVGHILVIPKKHVETIDKMTKEDLCNLNEGILKVSKGILKIADGLNVMQNNRWIAGQEVSHVHFHLIPRYEGDGYKFNWVRDEGVTEEENKEFLEKFGKFIS